MKPLMRNYNCTRRSWGEFLDEHNTNGPKDFGGKWHKTEKLGKMQNLEFTRMIMCTHSYHHRRAHVATAAGMVAIFDDLEDLPGAEHVQHLHIFLENHYHDCHNQVMEMATNTLQWKPPSIALNMLAQHKDYEDWIETKTKEHVQKLWFQFGIDAMGTPSRKRSRTMSPFAKIKRSRYTNLDDERRSKCNEQRLKRHHMQAETQRRYFKRLRRMTIYDLQSPSP